MQADVEHELTEKVEVLVYCPLTIRQRLLYSGLKQNIRMEELLAGLGLGSGAGGGSLTGSLGVSSLMNLVMQFRKVCNHPELFERREPRSPLLLGLPATALPRLPVLDPALSPAEAARFSVLRADRVHSSLRATRRTSEFLEVSDSAFSFLRFVPVSAGQLERCHTSLYHRYQLAAAAAARYPLLRHSWARDTSCGPLSLQLRPPAATLPRPLVFVSPVSGFLHHVTVRVSACPETISHRVLRSRAGRGEGGEGGSCALLPEHPHQPRPPRLLACVPAPCPTFLQQVSRSLDHGYLTLAPTLTRIDHDQLSHSDPDCR